MVQVLTVSISFAWWLYFDGTGWETFGFGLVLGWYAMTNYILEGELDFWRFCAQHLCDNRSTAADPGVLHPDR